MATQQFNQVTYGLTQPLYPEFQPPIIAHRNPATSDKAQLGTQWVNKATDGVFFLTNIINNQAVWTSANGGTGISTLTGDTGGPLMPAGGNINIVGAATQFVVTGAGSTLTINAGSHIATQYDGDTGSATPLANVLNIIGGASTAGINITTNAMSNDVEIILNDSILLPATSADGLQGVIFIDGSRFMHAFGTQNTFLGQSAGNLTLTSAQANVGIGDGSLAFITTGSNNTGCGSAPLVGITSGTSNTGIGSAALSNITTGNNNTAVGSDALAGLIAGASNNTALGQNVAELLDTGNDNIFIGNEAAIALQTSESSNIIIGNAAVVGDNNTIRIGTSGAGAAQQNKCFIAGIFGITVGGSGIPVNVDNAGQLGTVVSSERFKENIVTLNNESNLLHKLRPVKFNYKTDKSVTNFGFIAEEVQEVLPELMIYDIDNEPMTIRYMDVIALLVKEVQLLKNEINNLNNKIN